MSVQALKKQFISKVGVLGKVGLNSLYPNDFELYVFALELVNSKGDTEEYFIFPVNPSNFEESSQSNTTVTKTMSGVVTLSSESFNPVDIMISGTFGRRFKMLIGGDLIDFSALSYSTKSGLFSAQKAGQKFKKSIFNSRIKSGYGSCKVLEAIVKKSHALDQYSKPYSLYLYNLALGNNYLAKALNITFKQDMSTNGIWNYTLSLKGLGNLDSIDGGKSLKSLSASLATSSVIQGASNVALNKATSLLT